MRGEEMSRDLEELRGGEQRVNEGPAPVSDTNIMKQTKLSAISMIFLLVLNVKLRCAHEKRSRDNDSANE